MSLGNKQLKTWLPTFGKLARETLASPLCLLDDPQLTERTSTGRQRCSQTSLASFRLESHTFGRSSDCHECDFLEHPFDATASSARCVFGLRGESTETSEFLTKRKSARRVSNTPWCAKSGFHSNSKLTAMAPLELAGTAMSVIFLGPTCF